MAPKRVAGRVGGRAGRIGLALLLVVSMSGAPAHAKSQYSTLLGKEQLMQQQIQYMETMLLKAEDAQLAEFIRKQLEALKQDLRRLKQQIHDTCERAAHPKDMSDQIERLAREEEFRRKNLQQMSQEGLKALGGTPEQQLGETLGSGYDYKDALQEGAGVEAEAGHLGGISVLSGVLAILDIPLKIYDAWKKIKPFSDTLDRKEQFYNDLNHCPPPPPDESDKGTPQLRPFPPPPGPPLNRPNGPPARTPEATPGDDQRD